MAFQRNMTIECKLSPEIFVTLYYVLREYWEYYAHL